MSNYNVVYSIDMQSLNNLANTIFSNTSANDSVELNPPTFVTDGEFILGYTALKGSDISLPSKGITEPKGISIGLDNIILSKSADAYFEKNITLHDKQYDITFNNFQFTLKPNSNNIITGTFDANAQVYIGNSTFATKATPQFEGYVTADYINDCQLEVYFNFTKCDKIDFNPKPNDPLLKPVFDAICKLMAAAITQTIKGARVEVYSRTINPIEVEGDRYAIELRGLTSCIVTDTENKGLVLLNGDISLCYKGKNT